MKRFFYLLLLLSVLFTAAPALCEGTPAASDADKLEKTRAIMAENSSTKSAAPAQPWRTDEPSSLAGAGGGMVKSLLLCIGIFLVGAALYKKFAIKGGAVSGRRIRVIERSPLSSRTFLSLVEVDGKTILLSCGPDRVSFAQATIPTASVKQTEDFEKALKAVCERKDS